MTIKNQLKAPVPNTNSNTDEFDNDTKIIKKNRKKTLNYYVYVAYRKWLMAKLKKIEKAGVKQAALVNNIRLHPLFQSKPRQFSTYTKHKNRSFTDGLEPYQYGADKERQILQWNMQYYGRKPKKEIVIHLLKEFSAKTIQKVRKWIFDYLKQAGIRAITNIELTRERPIIGKPNNRVHFHILTDDPRSEAEIREIFRTACDWSLLTKKNFRIDYAEINNGYWYFEYFTKYDRKAKAEIEARMKSNHKVHNTKEVLAWDWDGNKDVNTLEVIGKAWRWKTVVLFRKYTGLNKFKTIGKWFEKSQKEIWNEIKAYMAEKNKNEQK